MAEKTQTRRSGIVESFKSNAKQAFNNLVIGLIRFNPFGCTTTSYCDQASEALRLMIEVNTKGGDAGKIYGGGISFATEEDKQATYQSAVKEGLVKIENGHAKRDFE